MERSFPPYMSITSLLAQTAVLSGLTYRAIRARRKQFLGVWVTVGLTIATFYSYQTTAEVIHSRMTLPAVQANGKPS